MNFNVFIYVTLLAFSAQGTTTPKTKIENDEKNGENKMEWKRSMRNACVYIIAYIYRVHLTMKRIN